MLSRTKRLWSQIRISLCVFSKEKADTETYGFMDFFKLLQYGDT